MPPPSWLLVHLCAASIQRQHACPAEARPPQRSVAGAGRSVLLTAIDAEQNETPFQVSLLLSKEPGKGLVWIDLGA